MNKILNKIGLVLKKDANEKVASLRAELQELQDRESSHLRKLSARNTDLRRQRTNYKYHVKNFLDEQRDERKVVVLSMKDQVALLNMFSQKLFIGVSPKKLYNELYRSVETTKHLDDVIRQDLAFVDLNYKVVVTDEDSIMNEIRCKDESN